MGSERNSSGPGRSAESSGHTTKQDGVGFLEKLVLTAFPFLLVLLFLILEWWLRGRS